MHKHLSDDKLVNFCFCTKTFFLPKPVFVCLLIPAYSFTRARHPSLTRERHLCALVVSRESYHRPVCRPQAAPPSPVPLRRGDILTRAQPQFRVQN